MYVHVERSTHVAKTKETALHWACCVALLFVCLTLLAFFLPSFSCRDEKEDIRRKEGRSCRNVEIDEKEGRKKEEIRRKEGRKKLLPSHLYLLISTSLNLLISIGGR